ncbi:MAG: CDP-alcohol phosphatidyltransferase family protein [Bacteroidales bacterium]
MKRDGIFTLPNILGFYRLLMFPVILWFAISGRESLFAVFLVISLLTDVADGYIARRFNMESEFGARLDSFADNFTYLLAFVGIYFFKLDEFMPHLMSFFVFIGFLMLTIVVALFKFGRLPSFHLYMTKISGYIQGAFFICLFTIGFITPFFYFMIIWGILGAIEHIAIQLVIPEMRSNVKGLYWVLKEKNVRSKQQS